MRRIMSSSLGTALLLIALAASACGSAATDETATAAQSTENTVDSTESTEAEPALPPTPVDQSTLPEELQGTLTSTTGEEVNLADFRGDDVVLWFWAPW